MRPARGLLLVRPVEPAETYAGGLIVVPETTRARLTAHQAEVLDVGALEACDDDDCERRHVGFGEAFHPCPVGIGDWLIVRPRSFIDTSDPERREWLIKQRDVLAIIREQA